MNPPTDHALQAKRKVFAPPEQWFWGGLAAIPGLAAVLLLVFAFHTSQVTGSWPTYANPDPKTANSVLYAATGLGLLASLPSLITLALGLTVTRRLRLSRKDWGMLIVGCCGFAALMFLFAGNLGDWFMD